MTPIEDEPSSDGPRLLETSLPFTTRGGDPVGYQRLWLHIASRTWRTLAIVPAEEGISTFDVAGLITDVGVDHGASIGVFDFRDVQPDRALAAVAVACETHAKHLIFATRSIKENLATIPLARAADGVVLCVSLGSTKISLVEETIDRIGKERFFGSVIVREPRASRSAPPRSSLRSRTESPW
jgi:hypothetical protein